MDHLPTDILDRIQAAYYQLTTAERRVADFVLMHHGQVQLMSITQLAEECGVAEATISRFCRSLKLKGYNAFKLELARHGAPAQPPLQEANLDTFQGRCRKISQASQDAVTQTVDSADARAVSKAVSLFHNADRVICMGQGGSMIMASECAHLFSTVSHKFFALMDSHIQVSTAATMSKRDVILLFSYSGSTRSGLEILELAKAQGASTVLVTRYVKSPAAKLADVALCCGSNEGPFQLGSIPARVAQLVLMDILFQEFCQKDPQRCSDSIQRIAAALSEKHV